MAKTTKGGTAGSPAGHEPFVPDNVQMPEFTWSAVLVGVVLGIIFGASSLYLVLKVGLTVSASIPVAVLSITLFRAFSKALGMRRSTILENNIVQTTGSAGESIAFGVGVTMPALLMLGYEMDAFTVMTVAVLGGLLGILMMIPLRRAFIVRQHGKLTYPEGTACAEVLIVGEEGGATAKTVFIGFGLAFLFKVATSLLHLWKEMPNRLLYNATGQGLRGAEFGGELSAELLGVGYIIGPRVASIMLAGGVLGTLVIGPLIAMFSAFQSRPISPGDLPVARMDPEIIHKTYILYIGAGAVAAGGVVSMLRAMPLIFGSLQAGWRELSAAPAAAAEAKSATGRTQRDLPLWLTLVGGAVLVVALMAVPQLGLGFSWHGILAAVLIVSFGFLFVTVSARLTGEIGSSSNPISGMTVATLLFTCLIFLAASKTDKVAALSALSVAAVVCIASSNGGTTAQDLKTGYLVGSTPIFQQIALTIGAVTSALVIGLTLVWINQSGTIYSQRNLPRASVPNVGDLTRLERPGGEYGDKDNQLYHVLNVADGEMAGVPGGRYLVDDQGRIRYFVDPAINGRLNKRDDGTDMTNRKFYAPKTHLMAIIIKGVLGNQLPWTLVIIGVMIALTLELAGVPSLPFAVGVYLPIQASVPIFCGGAVRYVADRWSRRSASDGESSPGVLFASGCIAGGTITGVLLAFSQFLPEHASSKGGTIREPFIAWLDLSGRFPESWSGSNWPAVVMFSALALLMLLVGSGKLLAGQTSSDK